MRVGPDFNARRPQREQGSLDSDAWREDGPAKTEPPAKGGPAGIRVIDLEEASGGVEPLGHFHAALLVSGPGEGSPGTARRSRDSTRKENATSVSHEGGQKL